jgi:hypothetical protein
VANLISDEEVQDQLKQITDGLEVLRQQVPEVRRDFFCF